MPFYKRREIEFCEKVEIVIFNKTRIIIPDYAARKFAEDARRRVRRRT
ncbi:hypothetical protein DBT_0866 [Dissulfuribacter thermophilus]|uniref:Uncharacterized protein n=1 Tax=Dissulfuribacter thermophilus TaxID=1156395 RepID=A0A1B9F845_9BACT|nr:hypothetical protein DBT_0866 [Dissulfuribacter thermophilus]